MKYLKTLIIAALVTFTMGTVAAQQKPKGKRPAAVRTEKMVEMLELNEEQGKKLLVLNKKVGKARREGTKVAYTAELKKILTDAQFQKWKARKKQGN